MENPLKILGISPGSSLKEAKSSFKSLSLKFHPDKNSSPDASKRFISIKNAYDTIEKNPNLLVGKTGPCGESLSVEVKISAEDVYFLKEKIVSIRKLVRCKKCSGTGSEDKVLYVCTLCDGVGHISNDILEFLGKESWCPLCKGLGITPPSICLSCKGDTVVQTIIKERIPIRMDTWNRVLLNGKGNAGKMRGLHGDLRVLFIVTKGLFYFKEEVLNTDIGVSPAQFILGGGVSLIVCGEEIKFTMTKRTKSQNIVYHGKQITINFKLLIPPDTEENIVLYKCILNNEEQLKASFKQP